MFFTLEHFYTQAEERLNSFNDFIKSNAIEEKIFPDHFGYRCSTNEEFINLRAFFEFEASFVYQSIIAKRRIALIKLKIPLATLAGPLMYLELSDQKLDGSQKSGFDHVEFFSRTKDIQTLLTLFESKKYLFTKIERPHHITFDCRLADGLVVRIEEEALIQKIVTKEICP